MTTAARVDLTIVRGTTFRNVQRIGVSPWIYKPISAIANNAPVRITAAAHEMPDGWWFAVVAAKGLVDLNAECNPPQAKDLYQGTVIDADTIDINSKNGMVFGTHTANTGVIQYLTPLDLAGGSAELVVKDQPGGVELERWSSTDGDIDLDNTEKTITTTVSDGDTDAVEWDSGHYYLNFTDSDGVVHEVMWGKITAIDE